MKKAMLSVPVVMIGLAVLFYYARLIEPTRITVSRVDIETEKLSASFPELRVVQLSDIHMSTFGQFEQLIAKHVNELEPDLIVITGDFLKSERLVTKDSLDALNSVLDEIEKFLKTLKSRMGIWAVRGNYEIVVEKEISDTVLKRLRQAGIVVLCNQSRRLEVGDEAIHLLGVDFHDFPQFTITDFKTRVTEDGALFEDGFSRNNAYSHYLGRDTDTWQDYIFSGRMKYSGSERCGLGITIYSAFSHGYDKFYRLRWYEDQAGFFLDAHGSRVAKSGTGLRPQSDQWYRFKVSAETLRRATRLRAKVWLDGNSEPQQWQAMAIDESHNRLIRGTMGLWSWGEGTRAFDDLRVTPIDGSAASMIEDFDRYPDGSDPENWLDYAVDVEALRIAARDTPPDEFRILLSHTPDLVHAAAELRIDLMLAGHTHGGQIRVPFLGALASPARLGPKYTAGRFKFGDTVLYINRGLGYALMPIRFLCPPEITVIQLRGTGEKVRE